MTLPLPYGPPIGLADAKRIMDAAEREAARNGWPMAIAIVDSTSHLLMFHRLDHTQLGSVAVAIAKAESAVNFRRPTKAFEEAIAAGGMGLRLITMPYMIALEGGIPIVKDGQVIGGIGVSGMQSSQDAEVARAGLASLE